VRDLGAGEVVGYNLPRWEGRVKELMEGGEGVDVVCDAVGAVESGLKCLKYRGRVVIVGFAGRGDRIEEVKANGILLKAATVVGYVSGYR
jgi:NADPH:quinone reductase-like Zn-dependent oxidoreductase